VELRLRGEARLDRDRRVWYGEMRIPMEAIDVRAPEPGVEMRINFYRLGAAGEVASTSATP
jgi:hypothetical protein